jgi:hypothetical protein
MNVDQEFMDAMKKKFDVVRLTKFGDSENSAVDYFNEKLGSIPGLTGYTASGDGSLDPTSDGVIIKDDKGKKVLEFRFDGTITPQTANKYIQSLVDLSAKQTTIEDKLGPAKSNYATKTKQGILD